VNPYIPVAFVSARVNVNPNLLILVLGKAMTRAPGLHTGPGLFKIIEEPFLKSI
jgi:hypothetical protein